MFTFHPFSEFVFVSRSHLYIFIAESIFEGVFFLFLFVYILSNIQRTVNLYNRVIFFPPSRDNKINDNCNKKALLQLYQI